MVGQSTPEKVELSFSGMIKYLGSVFQAIPDIRKQGKVEYELKDVLMSAFSCMYMQHSSFLEFQAELKEESGRSNLETLLGVNGVPKSNQMKDIIDKIEPGYLQKSTIGIIRTLHNERNLQPYQVFEDKYNVTIDATQYFSSENINCKCCLAKKSKDKVIFSHSSVQAAICKYGMKEVFPLYAEEIANTDGNKKQDCESNAAKRLLTALKNMYPGFKLIINGDDLYSRKPMIELTLSLGYNYIFVAKPDSHQYLMDYVQDKYPIISTITKQDENKKYYYVYMKNVPLNSDDNAPIVNYFSVQVTEIKNGIENITYFNSWITDMDITDTNIGLLVESARPRWKIENECFNNLKNRGYHLEHNFGHGKKLSFNIYLLMLLAFLIHQTQEIVDELYQSARIFVESKKKLWDKIRILCDTLIFDSWDELLILILNPKKFRIVPI